MSVLICRCFHALAEALMMDVSSRTPMRVPRPGVWWGPLNAWICHVRVSPRSFDGDMFGWVGGVVGIDA